MNTHTKIIIITLTVATTSLLVMWGVNKYKNEKMYEEGIAQLFDESMTASYPLLITSANTLFMQASLFENIAYEAQKYSANQGEFQDVFTQINNQFINTPDGRQLYVNLMQYESFIPSVAYGQLSVGSKLRDKESRAFRKIEYARQSLRNWETFKPDSLIAMTRDVRTSLSEAMRDIDRYRNPYQDADAWRNINANKSCRLHEQYNANRNWPFSLINSCLRR